MADGQWAWRLQAAREDRRIAANGQIESVSPVHGSVLIQDGVACFTAGRSSYLDGGIDLCRVDPETGASLSRTPIYSPDVQTGRQPSQAGPAFMPGSRADILSADDSHLYLQDSVFSKEGKVQAEGKAHLFALTGFLDDTWPHRSYWIFGTQVSLATGCSGRDKNLIYGRLLVFDGSTIYGYGRAGVHWSNQLQDGPYRLFAQRREDGTRPWDKRLAIQVRAMLLAGKVLFVAGPNAELTGWGEGRGAKLLAISAADGAELGQADLDCPPVFDGMAAAYGRLYLALEDGRLACLAAE
jgi:hypothetical protein